MRFINNQVEAEGPRLPDCYFSVARHGAGPWIHGHLPGPCPAFGCDGSQERRLGSSSAASSAAGSASSFRFSPAIAVAGLTAAALTRHSGRQHVQRQGTIATQPGDSETPSNAHEEWLLSLELPTPLKPVLGSSALGQFRCVACADVRRCGFVSSGHLHRARENLRHSMHRSILKPQGHPGLRFRPHVQLPSFLGIACLAGRIAHCLYCHHTAAAGEESAEIQFPFLRSNEAQRLVSNAYQLSRSN